MPGSRKVWSMSLLLLAAAALRLPAQEPSTAISLSSGSLDTSRRLPAVPEALRVRPEDTAEDEIVLVKFPAPATARQIEALRQASLRIYTYLPYYSYLVRMPTGKRSSLAGIGASWTGPYQPLYKISPAIAAMSAGEAKR